MYSQCWRCGKRHHFIFFHSSFFSIQLNFDVEILATKCINNGAPTTFSIYTHGLNDKIRITVQTNCSCSCSKVPRQINSPRCSNHGTYECGVCTCAKGYYGRECECDTASPTVESKIQQCKKYERGKAMPFESMNENIF